jgi:hypothetical protein
MKNDQEVLFCNDAFYQAFMDRDEKTMANVWSESAQLLCIHPGGAALRGREHVMASWQDILRHDNCPRIIHRLDQLIRYDALALVTCYEWDERQPSNFLLATNGFVWEENGYRMVFHQAGPTPIGPLDNDEEPTPPIH